MPKWILFGDSHSARDRNPGGSPRLAAVLRERFSGVDIINAGVPGHTTRDALGRLEEDVILHDPDRVIVFFGSNDAGHHRDVGLKEFERNLRHILRRIGPSRCLVVTPPPVDEEKQLGKRDNATLKRYGAAALKVAQEEGAERFDLFEAAPEAFTELLKEDGLHLNPAGDEWLGRMIGDKMAELSGA